MSVWDIQLLSRTVAFQPYIVQKSNLRPWTGINFYWQEFLWSSYQKKNSPGAKAFMVFNLLPQVGQLGSAWSYHELDLATEKRTVGSLAPWERRGLDLALGKVVWPSFNPAPSGKEDVAWSQAGLEEGKKVWASLKGRQGCGSAGERGCGLVLTGHVGFGNLFREGGHINSHRSTHC